MPVPDELGAETFRLVVVDDERAVLEAIRRQLKPHADRVTVEAFNSGTEALLKMSEQRADALLIDVNMPELDGLEVIRRLRARERFKGVQLIAMTARYSDAVLKNALEAGATACMSKPVDIGALLALFFEGRAT